MDRKVIDTFEYTIRSGGVTTKYTLYLMRINGCYNDSLLVHKNDVKATLQEVLELFTLLHSGNISLYGDSYTLNVSLKGIVASDKGNKLTTYDGSGKGIYLATIDDSFTAVLGLIFNQSKKDMLDIAFYEDLCYF